MYLLLKCTNSQVSILRIICDSYTKEGSPHIQNMVS